MAAKSIRKGVSFDDSDEDRALLDAIARQQAEQQQSFSELCKVALRQYLFSQESTQSVLLFMELQQQINQLTVRVAALENGSAQSVSIHPEPATKDQKQPEKTMEPDPVVVDPVLNRLGPLLDDF